MIEVEATDVVLVGFAFAAVLTDDQARDGFEHFARTHDRTDLELRGGDRALARGRRDADQVLGRVLDVGDVPERRGARDDNVGSQRELQDDIAR